MEFDRTYENLYYHDKAKFGLMKNSANALVLQFNSPLYYDLTIPSASSIKRLLSIFQDGFDGKIIDPSNVDCCIPSYQDRYFNLDFGNKFSNRIKEGLELCFKLKNKYDTYPLQSHLNNADIFGNEGGFFRFRKGMEDKTLKQVKNYFKKEELDAFVQIGNFVKPYAPNLHRSHNCS